MSIKSIREVHINSLQSTSEFNFCKNTISLCQYTPVSIFFIPFLNLFSQPSFIFFTLQSILDIIFNNSFLTLSLLLFLTIFFFISELKSSIPLIKRSNHLNRQRFDLWNGLEFIKVQSKDLQVGQIIKVSDWVPADLIILASEHEIVYTKSYMDNIEEKVQPQALKTVVFYEDSNFTGLKKLFGVVEVEEVNEKFSEFEGKFKIRGKPNSVKLSNHNVLYQGSKVKGMVLGIVIFTGQDTKYSKSLKNKYKNSLIVFKINKMSYLLLVPLGLFVVFSTVPAYLMLDEFGLLRSIGYFVLLYSNFLPISMFVVLEILRIVHYLYTRPVLKNSSLGGLHRVENIGNTEYVFCDEKCIASPPIISSLLYQNEVYTMHNEDHIQATLVTDRSLNTAFLKQETENEIWNMVILSTSVQKIGEKFVGVKNEIAMIKAAEKNGVLVKLKTSTQASLKFSGQLAEYEIISINIVENRTRVFVQSENSAFMLVQGPAPAVSYLMTDAGNYESEDYSMEMYSKGLMPFTILYKKLNQAEILKVSQKVKKISESKTNIQKKLRKFFEKCEKNLEFLTTVAVEYPIKEADRSTVQELQKIGVKVCFLSSENRFKAEAITNSLGLSPLIKIIGLESEASCYRVLQKAIMKYLYKNSKIRDESRLETLKDFEITPKHKNFKFNISEKLIVNHKIFRKFTIKNNLDCLNREYNWDKEVYLLVDRQSFLLCVKNKVTLKMFVGLIAASNGMYFYSLHPDDKVLLVNCIQNNLKHKPGVFAFCYNFWSLGMGQASQSSGSPSSLTMDISQIPFSSLPKLLSQYNFNWQISEYSVFWCIYKNTYEVLIQFLYQFFQQFSAASIWSPYFGLFFNLITSLQLFARKTGKAKFWAYLSSLSIQIFIVLCIFIYPSELSVFGQGKTENFEIFSKVLFICVATSVVLLNFWETRNFVGFGVACAVLVIICSFAGDIYAYDSGYFWVQTCVGGITLAVPGLCFSLLFVEKQKALYEKLSDVYKDSNLFTNENEFLAKKKNKLKFRNKRVESEFCRLYTNELILGIKFTLAALFTIFLIWTITTLFLEDDGITQTTRVFITVGFFIFFLSSFTSYFLQNSSFCISFLLFYSIAIKNVIEFSSSTLSIISTLLFPPVSFILLNTDWVLLCYINLVTYSLNIITISLFYSNSSPSIKSSTVILTTFLFLISSVLGFEIEKYYRKVFILTQKIKIQVENTQSVLEILLPEFVINRIKAGVRYIAEDRGEVTVIFCDICEFEQLCTDYSPKEFSSLLDSIFSVFDSLCEDFGVTKIETVGKTYMACCGLNKGENEISPARVACDFAVEMISEAEKINIKNGCLKVKIGINSGPVTAGVVGFHKPQFSLVGDTVNTASRMCSTLKQPNSIQISSSTYESLQEYTGLSFVPNTIIAKGKGEMSTFIVSKDKTSQEAYPIRNHSNLMPPKLIDWRKSVMSREDTELIPSIWKLSKKTPRQVLYNSKKIKSRASGIKLLLMITSIFYLLLLISNATLEINNNFIIFELVTKAIVSLGALILALAHSKLHTKQTFYYLTLSLNLVAYVSSVLSTYSKPNETFTIEVCSVLLLLNHLQYLDLVPILILNACLMVIFFICCYFFANLTVQEVLVVIFFGVINFISLQKIESKFQKSFNLKIKSDKEIRVTEHLLVQMMPAHVVYKLSEGSSVTDKLFDVTILYADIVGFTAWSSGKTPVEVVQMLSNLFTEFDKKCVEFGVYKVHTIGDCYVILGFLSGKREPIEECWRVYSMAKSMITIIEQENQKHNMQLAMRIGMHTGNLIAGVIGTNVVRYDIWGKDVMIANKMESHGQAGKICVSQVSKGMLEEADKVKLSFEYNHEVDGIESYFIYEKL